MKIEKGTIVRKWAINGWRGEVLRVLAKDAGTPYAEAEVIWHEPCKRHGYCLISALEEDVRAFGEPVKIKDIPDGKDAYMSGQDGEDFVWVHMKVNRSQVMDPTDNP